jgi:hypothetical protein
LIEIWKPVNDYEGLYEVSNLGRIRSLDRVEIIATRWGSTTERFHKGKILKPQLDGRGNYLHVTLGRNNTKQVHRLVADAFIPNINNYPQINHKDEDKTNNCVDNLEWCTAQYNNTYGTRIGMKTGEKHHNAKLSKADVTDIKTRIANGELQKDLASEYGVSKSQISAINVGRCWGCAT